MPKLSESDLEPYFKVNRAWHGVVVNFRNAYDGKFYIQSTGRTRSPLTLKYPRKTLEDGVEESLDSFQRHHLRELGFEPFKISCETRTYVMTSLRKTDLIMSCLISLLPTHSPRFLHKWIHAKFSIELLEKLARDMAAVFQNAEISRLTTGRALTEFESSGWYAKIFCKLRLSGLKPWRRFPVAILGMSPEKGKDLGIFPMKE